MKHAIERTAGACVVIAALSAIGWYLCLTPTPAPARARAESAALSMPASIAPREVAAEPEQPNATELAHSVSVVPSTPEPAVPYDENVLMNTLRELGDSAPQRSLEMAREGNLRFPNSPDAAERAWYVCKSLVNLENFYDAREEAKAMVAKYPGTPWASDIQRHLLVNPLDLPGDPAP
jgi:hypothetical protein